MLYFKLFFKTIKKIIKYISKKTCFIFLRTKNCFLILIIKKYFLFFNYQTYFLVYSFIKIKNSIVRGQVVEFLDHMIDENGHRKVARIFLFFLLSF